MNATAQTPIARLGQWLILGLFLATTTLMPGLAAAQGVDLPNIGDSGASDSTPEHEHRLGQAALNSLRRQHAVLGDPLVESYVQNLGYSLVSASDTQERQFHFFVVDDSGINAFAMPGGYIGVNYGLILDTQSESELAAVMAHEISHVTQRHYARTYEAHKGAGLATTAALIAAIILGGKSDQAGQAAAASIAAGSAQSQLNFTRSNEKEADRMGIKLLAKAGFDPQAMADFFQRMQQSTRLYGAELPEFLRTHPVTTARIADARNRAAQMPHHQVHEHKAYFLVRARLRVLGSNDAQDAVTQFKKELASGSYLDEDAERYGYALALTKAGDYAKALAELKPLLAKAPERIAYRVAQAQAQAGAGHTDQALETYRQALKLNPYNPVLSHYYATTLLQANQPKQASKYLHEYLQNASPTAGIYRLLARAEGQAGDNVDSQIAMAEYYHARGELHEAIRQLHAARRAKHLTFYQSSRIDARLKEFENQAAALPKDSDH